MDQTNYRDDLPDEERGFECIYCDETLPLEKQSDEDKEVCDACFAIHFCPLCHSPMEDNICSDLGDNNCFYSWEHLIDHVKEEM